MAVELYVNDPGTTLASSALSSDTSIVVNSSAGYPSTGNFRILVGTEIMIVTAVSGTTWTVTRAAEGTSASGYPSTTAVNHILTAGGVDGIRAAISQFGTYANLPTTNMVTGDRYKATDSMYELIYNGTSWDHYVVGTLVQRPDPLAFTTTGITPTTSSSVTGPLVMTKQNTTGGSYDWSMQLMALPTPPYSLILGFQFWYSINSGQNIAGIVVQNSSSTNIWAFGCGYDVANIVQIYFNNPTTYGGNNTEWGSYMWPFNSFKWIKFQDDGTNWNWFVSLDRQNWMEASVLSRNSIFTPNQVGFGFTGFTTTSSLAMTCFDWEVTNP